MTGLSDDTDHDVAILRLDLAADALHALIAALEHADGADLTVEAHPDDPAWMVVATPQETP